MTLLFVNEYKAKYTLQKNSVSKNCNRNIRSEKPPRPRNAFMLYRQEKHKSLSKSMQSKEISKIVAQMWRNETEEARMEYERLAEVEKLNHIVTYPQYKYAPKQRKKAPLSVLGQKSNVSNDKENFADLTATQPETLLSTECTVIDKKVQGDTQSNDDQIKLFEDIACFMDQDNILTLPSQILDDSQILPDSTELDLMAIKDYELYTLLSVMSKF